MLQIFRLYRTAGNVTMIPEACHLGCNSILRRREFTIFYETGKGTMRHDGAPRSENEANRFSWTSLGGDFHSFSPPNFSRYHLHRENTWHVIKQPSEVVTKAGNPQRIRKTNRTDRLRVFRKLRYLLRFHFVFLFYWQLFVQMSFRKQGVELFLK